MAPSTVTPFIQNQSHEERSASCGLTPSLIHQRDKVTEHEPKTLKVNLSTMKFTTAKMKMNLQFKKKSKRPSAHTHREESVFLIAHTFYHRFCLPVAKWSMDFCCCCLPVFAFLGTNNISKYHVNFCFN